MSSNMSAQYNAFAPISPKTLATHITSIWNYREIKNPFQMKVRNHFSTISYRGIVHVSAPFLRKVP